MVKAKTVKMSPAVSALVCAACALCTELLSLYIQPGLFRQTLYDIVTRPALIPLNLLPVAVFTVIGYFAFGSVFWGAAPAALVFPLLSYVNLLKIEGREDAFVPADIGLIREALSSAQGYSLNLHLWLLIIIILYAAAIVILGFFIKSARPRLLIRAASVVCVLAAFLLSVKPIYGSKKLFDSFPVSDMYNIPYMFNTLGFNYCFLHNFNLYPIDKPEGYDRAQAESFLEEYEKEGEIPSFKPNVIFVMGEAFSDITNGDAFEYESAEQNPIWRFNELVNSPRAVSGHIAVSNVGAGTANTEFDIMTGTPTNMISDMTTSAFRVIHKKTPSVANLFENAGYNRFFMHPGDSWFYNRSSVYSYFGVTDQVFSEAFDPEKDKKGNLISDAAFLREIKSDIERRRGVPQFMYTVTLQNHLTYNYGKYGYEPALPPVKTELSDRAREYLSVYCEGVRDTADAVYELAQYLDGVDEPTLLVFFGDHLPNLGEDFLTYRELGCEIGKTGSVAERLSAYETPFVIYANNSFCQSRDFEKDAAKLGIDGKTISDIYLGAAVCELIGFDGVDPYIDFLNDARRVLPAFNEKDDIYVQPDGSVLDNAADKQREILKKLDILQYYRLTE